MQFPFVWYDCLPLLNKSVSETRLLIMSVRQSGLNHGVHASKKYFCVRTIFVYIFLKDSYFESLKEMNAREA